jgi:hypothetical protein
MASDPALRPTADEMLADQFLVPAAHSDADASSGGHSARNDSHAASHGRLEGGGSTGISSSMSGGSTSALSSFNSGAGVLAPRDAAGVLPSAAATVQPNTTGSPLQGRAGEGSPQSKSRANAPPLVPDPAAGPHSTAPTPPSTRATTSAAGGATDVRFKCVLADGGDAKARRAHALFVCSLRSQHVDDVLLIVDFCSSCLRCVVQN